jgi:hypothetical protein
MQSILVVSSAEEDSKQIISALGPEYTVDYTNNPEAAVSILKGRHHVLAFIGSFF